VPRNKHRDRAYRGGPCRHWVKIKNPESPAMKRAAEVDWSKMTERPLILRTVLNCGSARQFAKTRRLRWSGFDKI